jgi:hypothetical protein
MKGGQLNVGSTEVRCSRNALSGIDDCLQSKFRVWKDQDRGQSIAMEKVRHILVIQHTRQGRCRCLAGSDGPPTSPRDGNAFLAARSKGGQCGYIGYEHSGSVRTNTSYTFDKIVLA